MNTPKNTNDLIIHFSDQVTKMENEKQYPCTSEEQHNRHNQLLISLITKHMKVISLQIELVYQIVPMKDHHGTC